mmetsp:Transcript_19277/g.25125  ORF Transcript_19277/g.25125 Transcript_19277/m.25125 type:complete len:476 (-) Transcript_19277:53-1480(-)|eukprot:CAMPEP_0184009254 /NCGR_PEP_ID=MMETSP0954-20121128/2478_1 /TAXON_ID=627963 /ORGANISM="Aplanochytrium sp, Strain PBS07" /LENGTH=475 /DNA_ID=CAMNT_0026288557 /DNA_START=99 /DNA_END=1523 /DNA_ORIENTATION=+
MDTSEQKRTKIVATIGPASNKPEVLKKLIIAGMNVARLNFSHGSYEDHAKTLATIRSVSAELGTATTILQDLQGPKIRVSKLPDNGVPLKAGDEICFVPQRSDYEYKEGFIGIDYLFLAEEAKPGNQILIDDGLLEMQVERVEDEKVFCKVIVGGCLKSRKGVNLPTLPLRVPSMTEKDKEDLAFGVKQGVDWISLSFVRSAADIRMLKELLLEHNGSDIPVMAKIEKPQAIDNLEEIVEISDGIMVARGDLGVEMRPETVPRLQKQIIKLCNQQGKPVITATQMLDSMIHNPRPTRAEVSDVAYAISDGTDAIMLSGESAVGKYPIKAVEMMTKIALDTEKHCKFTNYPPAVSNETHAICEALNTIDATLPLKGICAFTKTGYTALLSASERPKALVYAFTPSEKVYHSLNLVWGVKPILLLSERQSFEGLSDQAETLLRNRKVVEKGDKILIVGGIPTMQAKGTNFIKIHTIS